MKEILNKEAIIKSYQKEMMEQYDSNNPFRTFEDEQVLFNNIRNGNIKNIDDIANNIKGYTNIVAGKMSNDPIKQIQFALVSGITLATRYAISGGLNEMEAYKLSDSYLQNIEKVNSEKEALDFYVMVLKDFTKRVYDTKTNSSISLPVTKAIKYIDLNLHRKIRISDIAKILNITPEYLSMIFHKYTGITISEYIRKQKINIAVQMLENSDYSIQRITSILSFPSQSAFTTYFKHYYNLTPHKYRENYKNKML